jgi:hypothetical protein
MIAAVSAKSGVHYKALATSSFLTRCHYRTHLRGTEMIDPWEVIQLLLKVGVKFVVMGTHGIGGYRSEPRATQDVDLLVTKKDHVRAVRILTRRFPQLEVRDSPVATRFTEPDSGNSVIDLMKPIQEVYRLAFRHSVLVRENHRIPTLEMALTAKFAARSSPNCSLEKKLIDASDFINIVKKNQSGIDLKKLGSLGERLYPSGGVHVLEMAANIAAGRRIEV